MSLEPTRRSFGLSYGIAWLTHDRSAQPGSTSVFDVVGVRAFLVTPPVLRVLRNRD
jgi:hypothetical protein